MEFRLLGSLEVVGVNSAAVQAHKPRALLALLLLSTNETVPADRLIDTLWDGSPPSSATKLVQTYVSQLRKWLGADRIATEPPGYRVVVASGELDLDCFERLRFSRPHEALALWRGPPLAEFRDDSWAQPEIDRLEEARLEALEERFDIDLADGRHADVIGELDVLVAAHPLRERLRRQLMLSLYRSGRQVEALAAYREGRRLLVELGLDPSPSLQRLERAILRQDAALEAPPLHHRVESDRLIGRETVLGQIAERLERSRLTTLIGPGGIGKTRLALESARRASGRYEDGVVVVELAALADSDLVAGEIARVLGVQSSTADALVSYLGSKRMLLVLDNFEQVADAAPVLGELLAGAPELTLLVTSRTALHLQAELRYPVPPLELPDRVSLAPVAALAMTEAVALFVERSRASRPDFAVVEENAATVAELCIRLDGLPLALELAGARASLLSPDAILSRLGRRLDLLKATDAAVPERHRTLRAAIEWSYNLLAPEQRELFAALAVFTGGFSADAAEAVAGTDVLDGLSALVDSSLIRAERPVGDEPRLGMLETIREYALERLGERGDEHDLRLRHAVFYRGVAERAEPGLRGPAQAAWLRRLDAERENLRAALGWAEESGNVELGLRIATALWRYWQIRAGLPEGRAHMARLFAVEADVAPSLRAAALTASGRLAFMHGDLDFAAAQIEEGLAIARSVDQPLPMAAMSVGVLALIAEARGDSSRAAVLLDEALADAQAAGDWFSHSIALMGRGQTAYISGDFDVARRSLEEALRAAREVGDVRNIALSLTSLGGVALEQEDYHRAAELVEEALAAQRTLGDRWGVARSLVSLGVAALGRGDDEEAQILFGQGLTLQLEADDRPGIAASLERIALFIARRGDDYGAACLFGAAAILREMVGTHPLQLVHHGSEHAITAVAAALEPAVFADAWSRGRSMTLSESVSYALDTIRRQDDVLNPVG